jgi:DNA-binding GntR family transcriptional regulator
MLYTLQKRNRWAIKEALVSPDNPEDTLPTIDRPVRLRDRVYEILRQKILDGEFPPGYKLPEKQLADQMNVSRTPVREAIQRLSLEGLVVQPSTGRAEVSEITLASIASSQDIREVLEAYACRLAAQRITKEQLKELRETHKQEIEALAGDDNAEQLSRLNRVIHETLVVASENEVLIHLVKHLTTTIPSYSLFALGEPKYLKDFVDSHGRIIAAIEKGDGDTAAREVSEHVQMAKRILSRTIEELS